MDPIQIGVVILMLGAVGAGVLWLNSSEASASDKRRARMMKRIGFKPGLASLDDPQTQVVGEQIRHRCRKCAHEDWCELWLDTDTDLDPTFCPNAKTFDRLTKADAKKQKEEPIYMV
jgi:hypothetical protein